MWTGLGSYGGGRWIKKSTNSLRINSLLINFCGQYIASSRVFIYILAIYYYLFIIVDGDKRIDGRSNVSSSGIPFQVGSVEMLSGIHHCHVVGVYKV